MKKLYLLAFFIFLSYCCSAQNINKLQKDYQTAGTDRAKILALDKIAGYYMLDGNKDSLAAEYGNKQIAIANQSRDEKLMTLAQLLNGRRCMSFGGVNDVRRLQQAEAFLQRALNMARDYGQPELEANALIQLASYNRKPRIYKLDKAMNYLNMAQSILASNTNDSLKVIAMRSTAAVYQAQGDALNAFRNYNNALNLAVDLQYPALIADSYTSLGAFYIAFEDYDKAIDYLTKSFKILQEHKLLGAENIDILSRIGTVYIMRKDYPSARKYFSQMHETAKRLGLHEMMVTQPLFYMEAAYLEERNYTALMKTLENPQLRRIIKRYNQEYLMDFYRGAIFDKQGRPDSAEFYYSRVLAPASQLAPPETLMAIYTGYGFFKLNHGGKEAGLQWIEKAKDAALKVNDLRLLTFIYHNLDSAYVIAGQKARAYDYRVQYDRFTDSVKSQSKSRQLTLAEINAESIRLKAQQQKQEEALRKKHNLQYLGITAAIASVFILLVLLGFFTTSASIIRGLGFFAFIFFFEFVTLLCDNVIHHWTHGEPLKIMAIKIFFVALLLPLHHYVEEKVIHHLIHRKKIKLSKIAIIKRRNEHEEVN